MQKQLNDIDLCMAQYVHLRSLTEERSLKQIELSATLGIDKPSSMRVLDELDHRNLILCVRSQSDRRVVVVSLIRKG